jgi:hypothetical protein
MTVLLAPNLLNSLSFIRRLPLVEDSTKTVSFSGFGIYMIWVPSRFGGVLEVGCKQATAKIDLTHNGAAVKDPAGNTPPQASKVTCQVSPGEFGWYFATVSIIGTLDMWATFVETGLSREQNDENANPLIPWNFWYFPNANSMKELTAWGSSHLKPCQKYESAFGKSDVLAWEKANHNDPSGTTQGWEGHCHNSAYASFYFQTPPPGGKAVHGVTISCEEIKFLATEWVGAMKVRHFVWSLPGLPTDGRGGPFHQKKPADDPVLFGKEVGNFHKSMRDGLLVDRIPLVMDLRNSAGGDHSEVWNQAVYRYVSHYWETLPHGDWKDIQVRTFLNANDDRMRGDFSSSGLPAKVVNGPKPGGKPQSAEPDADSNALKRNQTLLYRVKFKDDGDIDETDSINRWFSVKLDGQAAELHAPRFVIVPDKPTGNSSSDANVKIDPADVLSILALRDRFK